jgi:hypothetical protein
LQAIDAGAQDYIVKPFSARELIARIGAQLELARLHRQSGDRYRALINTSWDVTFQVSPDWTEMRSLEGQGLHGRHPPPRHQLARSVHPHRRAGCWRLVTDAYAASPTPLFIMARRRARILGPAATIRRRPDHAIHGAVSVMSADGRDHHAHVHELLR